MPTQQYSIDGPSLGLSTTITGPSPATTTAPDGYYSDGVIVRQLVSGVLLPAEPCDECHLQCGSSPYTINTSVDAHLVVSADLGLQNGAVVVTIQTDGNPIGLLMSLGSLSSGVFSSTSKGLLVGADNTQEVYVGDTGAGCTPSGTYANLAVLEYRAGSMIAIGTESKTVSAGQLDLTAGSPGTVIGVIPKTNNNHTALVLDLFALCTPAVVLVTVDCPSTLPSFVRGPVSVSSVAACATNANLSGYYVHVAGSGGLLAVNDFVFSDSNGFTPLPDGFYIAAGASSQYDYIEVANGVIVSTGFCGSGGNYLVQRCLDSLARVVYSPITLTFGETLYISEEDCLFNVKGSSIESISATISSIVGGSCSSNCVFVELENTSGALMSVSYVDCAGGSSSINVAAGQKEYLCMRSFVPGNYPGLLYQILDCDCSSLNKYEATLCGNPSASTVVVASVDALSAGDLVLLDGSAPHSDCYYTIGSSSVDPYDHLVVSSRSDISCSDVCVSLTVENTSGAPQEISFDDCNGAAVELGLDNGALVTICAKSGSLTAPLCVVTYEGCNC